MPVPKGTSLDPAATRAKVLNAAAELFYERGIAGASVNEVAAWAGVSKLSVYHHFVSKDGLVKAVLERRSERVTVWLTHAAQGAGHDPRAQLRAIFDALGAWYAESGFRGCAMVNSAVELRSGYSPALTELSHNHLVRLRRLLFAIAEADGSQAAAETATRLLLIVEGATTVAFVLGAQGAAESAYHVAIAVLDAAQKRPCR